MEEKTEVKGAKTPKKPTYADLEKRYAFVVSKYKELVDQMQELNLSNMFKRLDYCFEVIKYEDSFIARGYSQFIDDIIAEVVSSMRPAPEIEQQESDEQEVTE